MGDAHRLPIINPREGESLEGFLTRVGVALGWPTDTMADDFALFRRLLEEFATSGSGAQYAAYIVRALSFSADPGMALRNLDRYVRAHSSHGEEELRRLRDNSEHLHFLCSLFSFSEYLSEVAIRHPEFLPWVMTKGRLHREKKPEQYQKDLAEWMKGVTGRDKRRAAATVFKKRELLRIGIRDLMELGGTQALCRELSNLAQAIIEVAYRDVYTDLAERFGPPINEDDGAETGYCIYAMGKFGAGELNFSSDVDLVFLYDEEGETTGAAESQATAAGRRITNHEFFNRLSREFIQYLSGHNEQGFLFRVDARLRPEGAQGPLARSRSAYAAYLSGAAALWEKIAYLKARFTVGDAKVAAAFDQVIETFVYTDNNASELFPEVARLKRRIDHDALTAETRELDIKRGRGGIREIEFIVAGQQLLHGQTMPELRIRPTLDALKLLVAKGLVVKATADTLEKAYHLFRRIEHTLQMMHENQTHRMPAERVERVALALRCGFLDPSTFEATLDDFRRFVRGEFERVFHEPDIAARLSLVDYLLGEAEPPREILEELDSVGLGDQEGFSALQQLAVGTRDFAPSVRGRIGFVKLLPMVLEELPSAAMPKLAVRQFDLLLRAAKGFTWVYNLCLSHPPILKMFMRTLGFGAFLGRQLIAHPEWLDDIFEGDGLKEARTDRALREFRIAVESQPVETSLRQLRLMKQLEGFLIAAQEVLAITPPESAALRTTHLAEKVIDWTARIASREVLEKLGTSALPVRWAVIGLGGLGDGQVHLCGDLDVAFVVEEDRPWEGESTLRVLDRIGQRMIAHLGAIAPEGQLWKIDARLRPDGAGSPLVATLNRFVDYYRGEAGLWEWQALTKARPVAGDIAFGNEVLSRLYGVFGEIGPVPELANQIRTMRKRMEDNVKLPRSGLFDLKTGPGGIVDAEFLVQFLQLSRPADAQRLFPITTIEAIEQFRALGDLPAADADFLRDHLNFLRTVQRHHRLLWETTKDFFPAEKERRDALRRGLADQLLADGLRKFDSIDKQLIAMRTLFNKYLGG